MDETKKKRGLHPVWFFILLSIVTIFLSFTEDGEIASETVGGHSVSYRSGLDTAAALEAAGIPNTKVMGHFDLMRDPHVLKNNWVVDIPVPDDLVDEQSYKTYGLIADFSGTPGDPVHKSDTLGQHNYEILGRYISAEKITELEERWLKKG